MTLGDAAAPLALLGVLGGGTLLLLLLRLAALAAAPAGFDVPALGGPLIHAVIGDNLDPLIGTAGSRWLFWGVLGLEVALLAAAAAALGWWALRRFPPAGDPRSALASRRDYRDMRGRGAEQRARKLRPSLGAGAIDPRDLGVRLGRTDPGGDELYASEEDVALIIAGPRSNKTSALVVPAVLSAPGPVIATSNKIDIITLTGTLRARQGTVFVLDPQQMTGLPQTWWWNPLAAIRDTTDAKRLVEHFVATVGGGHDRADPYFTPATARLLSQLALAASRSDGGSLRDVRRWLASRSDEPVAVLTSHGFTDAAAGLQGLLEAPEDQKGGVYETALTALSCLESEAVARYVTPPHTWSAPPEHKVYEFNPWQFLVGHTTDNDGRPIPHDTLYALTREGAGSAAPVVSALVDELLRTAAEAATATGGRLDPPLRAVLDEAANICPIKNLPDLYSYFGSMSIQVMTFLQSYEQGVPLWGKAGMAKLETAATIYLIGAGSHDAEYAERISRMVGEHDVPTWSDQHGKGGRSVSRSYRERRILTAADIVQLTKQQAVLISSGRKSGLIQLMPWYAEPEAGTISGHAAAAVAQVRQSAIAALGETNALARHLAQTSTQPSQRVGTR